MRPPQSNRFVAQDPLRCLCKGLMTCPTAKIYKLPLLDFGLNPFPQPFRFILKCPEEGVICPITQEPIIPADDTLPFDLENPDRIAIRLACQHEFSAFWLIFNWVHNKHVRCPLCRAGPYGLRIDVANMPHHVRVSIHRHMRKLKPVRIADRLDGVRTAQQFIETVAGKSFLGHFTPLCHTDMTRRMECIDILKGFDSVQVLSATKSHEIFTLFRAWIQCDHEQYAFTTFFLDTDIHPDDFVELIPFLMCMGMLNHVLEVMYGLSIITTRDNVEKFYTYAVFKQDEPVPSPKTNTSRLR